MHNQERIQQRIREAFDRAATTYDQHAVLQKQVAAGVEQLCLQHSSDAKHILDLGAGTGFVTRPLLFHYPQSSITALDLSQNMLNKIADRPNLDKVCADFMDLPFADSRFDLLVSSLALQWGRNLSALFADLQRILQPGGQLIFSTLLEDSLFELRQSWQEIDRHAHVNQFISAPVLFKHLQQSGFEVLEQRQEKITLHYATARGILQSIKGIGANTVLMRDQQAKGLGGRQQIEQLQQAYEKHRNPAGLPLCYAVMWIVAVKSN